MSKESVSARATSPRTIAGQAWASGLRPHLKRAVTETIVAIETQATAPYREALREADTALGTLLRIVDAGGADPATLADVAAHARAVHAQAGRLLADADAAGHAPDVPRGVPSHRRP